MYTYMRQNHDQSPTKATNNFCFSTVHARTYCSSVVTDLGDISIEHIGLMEENA
jgi:hypothetical protein